MSERPRRVRRYQPETDAEQLAQLPENESAAAEIDESHPLMEEAWLPSDEPVYAAEETNADEWAEPQEAEEEPYSAAYDAPDEGPAETPVYTDAQPPRKLQDDARNEKRSIFKPAAKRPSFLLSVVVNVVRLMVLVVVLGGLVLCGMVLGIAKGYVETAPTLDLAAIDEQAQTSFIYDANGNVICEYKGTENRVSVSIAAMPKMLQYAFVAVEDGRFYTHSGVDLKRIIGAFVSNLSSSSTQGGSTITQQLIKNTMLSSEQSYKRKIREAYLAMQLENVYTKDEILECYLNTIYLGENYYGVYVAAEGYFGKELKDLTLRECAMLAGTCNSPYYYNPRRNFYSRAKEGVDYPAITNDRTDYVLYRMYQCQFITWEQYQEALDQTTAHVLEKSPVDGDEMYQYAHYVEYAISEVVDILLEKEGLEDTQQNRYAMENRLRTGGYRVQLAIDTDIQNTLEDTIANWSKYPSLRDPADKVYRQKNADGTYTEIIQPQVAAVVLDYRTGEIKAIVGSRTAPTARKTLNRATDMKMPVGSSIKPLSVYAPALEKGYSPATVVFNMPLPISGWKDAKGEDSWPKNYGGAGYKGPETLRAAMTSSHNTAAAYTLLNLVGIDDAVASLNRMGVDNDHIDATPFGLSLGSSGITPMQMTIAYGVLANGGVYQEPISVLGISDSEGNVVWDGHAAQDRRRVFSSSTAYMIVDMLKSVVSSGTGTSAKISGQVVAGKTGTNSDQKGVFFAGMTGYYTSALWIGHDNYKALASSSTGSGAAAPLWQAYMSKIHKDKGLASRDILSGSYEEYGLVKLTTCAVSGQLATDACKADQMGYGVVNDFWTQQTAPTVSCQLHSQQNVCAVSGMLAGTYCPMVETRGVVTIPQGHPLYRFIGTKYEDVLRQYFGSSLTDMTQSCTYHTEQTAIYNDPFNNPFGIPDQDPYVDQPGVENTPQWSLPQSSNYAADAQSLIVTGNMMLETLPYGSEQYNALQNAIVYLQAILTMPGATDAEIAPAMSLVTQAMAGIY